MGRCGATWRARSGDRRGLNAAAPVLAVYESTFRDAGVMEWTLDETTMELIARLQLVGLG